MEQRALRLGDLVDDYCPRERRLTNHAVVAIVDEAIRQTRCTTCEAEHPYKDGKTPRRRKKGEKDDLYDQVLAGVAGQLVNRNGAPASSDTDPVADHPEVVGTIETVEAAIVVTVPIQNAPALSLADQSPAEQPERVEEAADLWPAHRPLIRATLPRIDGQQPAQPQRPIHEFTMRQQHGRGPQSFRGGQGNGGGGWHERGGGDGRGNRGGFRQGKPNGGGGRPNRPGGGPGKRTR